MATLRELKGRIGSVASSEKITGAMKMISSAKMRKAESELRRLLPFREQIEGIIGNLLSADATFSSPLTQTSGEIDHATVLVLGSDDGLCGAYNVNIQKYLSSHIDSLRERYGMGLKVDIMPVGKKMAKAVAKLASANTSIIAAGNCNSKSSGDDVKNLNTELQNRFVSGSTARVDVVFMNFISMSRQRPASRQILPVSTELFKTEGVRASQRPYLFEPDAQTVFTTVLPMFLSAVMQEVFAQNRASEQAARVMAMQSANDNAKKLLDTLHLEYNKLRQQSITSELLDIVGGQVKDQ
ncbi:MAG: ATP synthase F1 subunit gamma [Muribaculaceae bacterium]